MNTTNLGYENIPMSRAAINDLIAAKSDKEINDEFDYYLFDIDREYDVDLISAAAWSEDQLEQVIKDGGGQISSYRRQLKKLHQIMISAGMYIEVTRAELDQTVSTSPGPNYHLKLDGRYYMVNFNDDGLYPESGATH